MNYFLFFICAILSAVLPAGARKQANENHLSMQALIGKGYADVWHSRHKYLVLMGGRASKKSTNISLRYIKNIMKYPDANLLVIRQTARTMQDSCYAQLQWAILNLGAQSEWKCKTNPMELIYMKTGQKILFRGLDDPLKITSIMVTVGVLCWVWIEEAYEIMEDDFDKIEGSIRGLMPEGSGLWKQFTLTFNPWSDKSWLKRRFFDVTDDPRIFTKRVTYLCNEWLDDSDREHYEIMKTRNPRRYAVEGLGEWGTVDGLVYENYDVDYFNKDEIKSKPGVKAVFGLDFGYTNDPSAFVCSLVDTKEMVIYVFDEFSETQLSNTKIAEKITAMGYQKERIVADSAEPKSIDDLYTLGIRRIEKSRKGKDSILNGIQYIQDFKIIVHPKCVNFAREIAVYSWQKDRFGHTLNKPVDTDNHSMDALRYSMQNIKSGSNFSFE